MLERVADVTVYSIFLSDLAEMKYDNFCLNKKKKKKYDNSHSMQIIYNIKYDEATTCGSKYFNYKSKNALRGIYKSLVYLNALPEICCRKDISPRGRRKILF